MTVSRCVTAFSTKADRKKTDHRELFQPLLEMMEASESLTPNLSNPLYTQLTPPDEGNVPTFFIRDFFYIYYDIMEHGVSFDDICRHFEDDHGAKWTASILHLEETPSDPVSCVLKSSLDAPRKTCHAAVFY